MINSYKNHITQRRISVKHEINSWNTKNMLAEKLLLLLEKKQLSKITVSELVSLCNINRKTFYYHFTDVYDLFEWYLDGELEKALNAINPLDDFDSAITYSMNYMHENTLLRNCIDTPLGRDKIIQFLNKHLYPKAFEIISQMEHRYDKHLESDFKEFLVVTLNRVTILSIIDAIENPNGYDMEKMKRYLSTVFEASIEGFFRKI